MPVKRRFYKNDKGEKIFSSWMYDFYDFLANVIKSQGLKRKLKPNKKKLLQRLIIIKV